MTGRRMSDAQGCGTYSNDACAANMSAMSAGDGFLVLATSLCQLVKTAFVVHFIVQSGRITRIGTDVLAKMAYLHWRRGLYVRSRYVRDP